MKNLNVKKSTVVLTIFALVLLFTSVVYATSVNPINPIVINGTVNATNGIDTNSTNSANIIANNLNPVNTVSEVNKTSNVSQYGNTDLPQTGDASDYAVFMLIVVSLIVAVIAYKKVRDYNI